MTRFAIGLGSNQGDRLGHLRSAVNALESLGTITGVSPIYETEPVGGPDQGPFLNAVLVLESDIDAHDLLERLHRIEDDAGRVRQVRWGPRTLDLDILASDLGPVTSADLTIPHPRSSEREFVLRPLADVWPQAPVADGLDATSALDLVGDQGVERLRATWVDDADHWVGSALLAVQFTFFAGIGIALVVDGDLPGTVGVGEALGGAFALAGLVFAGAASRSLGPALRAHPQPARHATLVETGPYAVVRHPTYTGLVVFSIGMSLLVRSALGLALTIGLAVFFYVKAGYEERLLRVRYAGYRRYMERVRWRLLPFLL